jgi:hypothetical protein
MKTVEMTTRLWAAFATLSKAQAALRTEKELFNLDDVNDPINYCKFLLSEVLEDIDPDVQREAVSTLAIVSTLSERRTEAEDLNPEIGVKSLE